MAKPVNRRQRRAQAKTGPARVPQATVPSVQQLVFEALQHHQAGRLPEAERLYRRVLATDPRHPDAMHLLGVIAHQRGSNDASVERISKAIKIKRDEAIYYSNLGTALKELGRLESAATACNAAIRLKPDFAEAHFNRGNTLMGLGHPSDAIVAYQTATHIKPDYAEAYFRRGDALRDFRRLEDALVAYEAAIRARPDYAEAHFNRGQTLGELGRQNDALAAYNTALRIRPALAAAHANRGNALTDLGFVDDALAAYTTAVCLSPDLAEAHYNRGTALKSLGRLEEALDAYETAVRLAPHFSEAHTNLIMNLHFQSACGDAAILATARRFAEPLERNWVQPGFVNVPDQNRRLRIGYVSSDFAFHPVGFFLERVLINHDRNAVETFCYSNVEHVDDMTVRLRAAANHWRTLAGLSDPAAAAQVTADGIDILIDLGGHTARNRLPMFARKPAPVQATWLGFWGTTGLKAIDYILSDDVTILPGEEVYYSEKVLRLPGLRFCYAPPDYAPQPAMPPCRRNGAVTFGSFNNLNKIGPQVVRLWASVLREVPGSRLLLKSKTLADDNTRKRILAAFTPFGVEADRLILRGASPHAEMLAEYGDMDIALDPFPFSGGLTSCESLWMGIPVVTMPGASAPSRQTFGFLKALGLTQWAATDPDDYLRLTAGLAADISGLTTWRSELRSRMAASALCDGLAFTRGLEAAFRAMWIDWCKKIKS